MVSHPASVTEGGGRWVAVSAERLAPWLAGFAARHGVPTVEDQTVHRAPDGALAEIEVPYPPLTGDLIQHVLAVRTVGVLLVRRGGHAAGVFHGDTLVASKVGSRHVQGRTAAGGWSQQRFARRRAGQTSVAVQAAADDAAPVLLGRPLDALRLGGDRTLADEVLTDPRLAPLRHLVTGARLDVPDPRLVVLKAVRVRDVRIRIVEPDETVH